VTGCNNIQCGRTAPMFIEQSGISRLYIRPCLSIDIRILKPSAENSRFSLVRPLVEDEAV
jgi:hypothetical protein